MNKLRYELAAATVSDVLHRRGDTITQIWEDSGIAECFNTDAEPMSKQDIRHRRLEGKWLNEWYRVRDMLGHELNKRLYSNYWSDYWAKEIG